MATWLIIMKCTRRLKKECTTGTIIKRRLSLEIGHAYHNYTEQKGPSAIYDAGFSIYDSKYMVEIIDVQVSLQYNITPKKFRNKPIMKNINSYIGLVLGYRLSKETTKWYTIDNITSKKLKLTLLLVV